MFWTYCLFEVKVKSGSDLDLRSRIRIEVKKLWIRINIVPDPDPPDPHVFGPPSSGSISQRYGSGSGSFYHQAKIVRQTSISTVL
jgi:hypothetical protein